MRDLCTTRAVRCGPVEFSGPCLGGTVGEVNGGTQVRPQCSTVEFIVKTFNCVGVATLA